MTSDAAPEGWVECRCGNRHWGRHGAAGLLLTDGDRVVLQHRAAWSHHGDTWGLPGGALTAQESPLAGALREAHEEAGVEPALVRPLATSALRHPDWSYTTVIARAPADLPVSATDAESVSVAWVPLAEVTDRPLLPAFADAWPRLRELARTEVHVVVDAANVVGSRPDGWWRDRRGATERLHARLQRLAGQGIAAGDLGLDADHAWPRWHLVVEGAARGVPGTAEVEVTEAAGSGDDAVVDLVARLRRPPDVQVLVVTADRGLADRAREHAAGVVRPGVLLDALDAV